MKVLEHERRARGWSQRRVADFCGLRSQATISRWECGNRRPLRPHADRLEALLGLPAHALLAETTNAADSDVDGVQEVDRRTARNEGRNEL